MLGPMAMLKYCSVAEISVSAKPHSRASGTAGHWLPRSGREILHPGAVKSNHSWHCGTDVVSL